MKMNRIISLIICICFITLSVLSIGLMFVHYDHNCDVHKHDNCHVCFVIDSIINLYKKMSVFINSIYSLFILHITSIIILINFSLNFIKLNPITLKVKMTN